MNKGDMGVESYIHNGLRRIKPYYVTRSSNAKGRWIGRKLVDVLSTEFKIYSREHYLAMVNQGSYKLRRKGEPVDILSSKILHGDVVWSRLHKHEPPVRGWCTTKEEEEDIPGKRIAGMSIAFEDSNLLVLDKPMGIPVHPTGQFFYNTVTEILKDHSMVLYPSYRLDKVTSGLLILAKNKEAARNVQMKISAREMNKVYLARVKGRFPHATTKACAVPFDDPLRTIREDSPIYTIDAKCGFPAGLTTSREASTLFYPLKYIAQSHESIVACKPLTGRTHQIRVHLARLGYPITNDSLYCEDCTMYPKRLQFMRQIREWETCGKSQEELHSMFVGVQEEAQLVTQTKITNLGNEKCPDCGAVLMEDPAMSQLQLYLHAWKYSDVEGTLDFATAFPEWTTIEST